MKGKRRGGGEEEKGRKEQRKGKMVRGEVAVSVQIWHPIASLCTLQEHGAVPLIVS